MAQQRKDELKFSCSICLEILKDPVTIPCGHNYCMTCIQNAWETEDQMKRYSCPQCRQTFKPRPDLVKNTMLAELLEELKKTGLKKTGLQAAPADLCYSGPEDVSCDVCTGRKLKAFKSCLVCQASYCEKHLQPHYESPAFKKHKLIEASVELQDTICSLHDEVMKIFTELIALMEKRRSDVKQQIGTQQKTEVSQVTELQEKLNQEITDLRRKDAELKRKDQQPTASTNQLRPTDTFLSYLEDMTAAVTAAKDKMQQILTEKLPGKEPTTRAELLRYSHHITMDPNTANDVLVLSEGNRKVTRVDKNKPYPQHPERFINASQVLSKEGLTGRCYWEVEMSGYVAVAVAYKSIGRSVECGFGYNDKSWSLYGGHLFIHDNHSTLMSGPESSRVGVYLDHSAGLLSFYSVSGTMTLLHRVQTTFTEPLHVGFWLYWLNGDTAELCDLK